MSIRDLYFAVFKETIDAMASTNFRELVLPGENHGIDFYFDPNLAIDVARHMSRHEDSGPAWAVHAAISAEAYLKWRKNDMMAEQLGDDAGSLFVGAEHFKDFSYDLIEPLEVLGAFA